MSSLKIGITGGIGAGKTTVAQLFQFMGAPVYNSDTRAKELMQQNTALKQKIQAAFGTQVYEGAQLNRAYLASIVFSDESKLQTLNSLVHPAVALDFKNWVELHASAPYVMKEAAILFESGAYRALDYTIEVYCPKDIRIARVVKRDQSDRAQVEQRINNQLSEEMRLALSDFVIYNDGTQSVIQQVWKRHQHFEKLSSGA